MWPSNFQLETEEMFPADRLLDFPWIQKQDVRVLPLNMSLKTFLMVKMRNEQNYRTIRAGNKDWYVWYTRNAKERKQKPITKKLIQSWKNRKEKFILLSGGSMWQRMGYPDSDEFNLKWIRYAPYFRNMAIRLSKHIMGGSFNAMHIRMGDYAQKRIDEYHQDVGSLFLYLSKKLKFADASPNLYIATEPKSNYSEFEGLTNTFNTMFSPQLHDDIVSEFDSLFTELQAQLRNDMFGNVEQMICALAIRFKGTSWSWFSQYIRLLRNPKQRPFIPRSATSQ